MPNAIDLCLASDVAGDLGVTADATVARCVTAASQVVARFCRRAFERGVVTEYPVGTRRPLLILGRAPIVSIESVTEIGAELDASAYTIEGDLAAVGMVRRVGGVWPLTAFRGGLVSETVDSFQGRSDVIAVEYTAGWVTPGQKALDEAAYPEVTLPVDVQEAAIQTAVQLYRARGVDPMVASESIGDWSVSYFAARAAAGANPISSSAAALLAPYIRLRAN